MGTFQTKLHDRPIVSAQVSQTWGQETRGRLAGVSVPVPLSIRLLIDTGSKRSTLVPSVVTRLSPSFFAMTRGETGTGNLESPLFWIRLEFPGTSLAPVPEIAVARLPLPPSLGAYHGLIGRDLLDRWHSFCYHGQRRRITIRDKPAWWSRWLPL